MSMQARAYDEGTYDSFLWDYEDAAAPSSGISFISSDSEAALLWQRRHEAIATLARRRMQPRIAGRP